MEAHQVGFRSSRLWSQECVHLLSLSLFLGPLVLKGQPLLLESACQHGVIAVADLESAIRLLAGSSAPDPSS